MTPALADVPMLRGLGDAERGRLLAAGRVRRYARREVVFHEGDPGDCLHLVISGMLAVRVTTPLGDVATLALLGPGEVFGELALLDPAARRTATVVALDPTQTLTLDGRHLGELRSRHPGIERFLTNTLASYVRRLSVMVLEAMYLPVEQRVARRLAELAARYPAGAGADIRLTQEDVASLAGATRATVNRVLRALESRGIVTLGRGRITVTDREQLAKAAR